MDKKQYIMTVVLAVVAGLVGGVVSSWLFLGAPVFAQKTPQVAEVIRAERFWVVDQDEKLRAALSLVAGEPSLFLYDKNGKRHARLGMVAGEPRLRLWNKNGKVIWSAP